ncbi:MAG: DNA-directed RNA polymerase subunit alpha [Rhodobacteraceae bacterium]|nr:DNA-directed RNA polymerase subunit alpha [Paracoccaceae bacterium]
MNVLSANAAKNADFAENWEGLIKPDRIDVKAGKDPGRQATITVEPLERGFGLTLGNSLRRVLLSSIKGAAITSVLIEGEVHEFSSIKGVREDITEIVLNLKDIRLSVTNPEGKCRLSLNASGSGKVCAGDIEGRSGVTILNPEHIICHLDKGASLRIELTAERGRGFVDAEEHRFDENLVGRIAVDSIFSPVRRVAYKVEQARKGQRLDYDKLVLNIETDGSVSPRDALGIAARIIESQISEFVHFKEPQIVKPADEPEQARLNPQFFRKVEELELSVRAANCLKNDNIVYIGDLVLKSEHEMLKTPNFGRKSLGEIKAVLAEMGLSLGMENPDWPPENVDELSKLHEGSY